VRKPSIFTEKEIRFLRELVKNRVPFMIVGLSAAALQGAPVVTQAVDLWFKSLTHPGISKALRKVDAVYVPPMGFNPPMFAGDGVDLFDIVLNMDGLEDFDKELGNAVDVPLDRTRVKVLSLERILASKRAANREKDQLTIPVLRDALAAIQRRKGS
jgi:hypothetical protein